MTVKILSKRSLTILRSVLGGSLVNLYLLTQSSVGGYDTYDSAVVAAISAKKARETHPLHRGKFHRDTNYLAWPNTPDEVNAKFIGKARKGTPAGIICASFNAG